MTQPSVDGAALEALQELFRHHAWATLTLIDYCAELSESALSGAVPGTRGPILETLEHVVAADQHYQGRFGIQANTVIKEGDNASLAVMRTAFQRQSDAWQSVLAHLSDFDISIPAEPQADPPWPEVPHVRDLLLLQAIHHGNDHRTQVCTILGSKGLRVPDVDGWAYWGAARVAR